MEDSNPRPQDGDTVTTPGIAPDPSPDAGAEFQPADEGVQFMARLDRLGRRPFVTWSLVAANVVMFVLMLVTGVHIMEPEIADLIVWGANFGPETLGSEPWRLVSSTFIHIGIIHVLFNMWVLWDGGRLVERLLGSSSFLLMYVLAGLGGSIASVSWNPLVVSAGASGAVFGVFGALFAIVVRKRPHIPPTVLAKFKSSTLAFVGYNLVFGLSVPGIDNAAHIGGLVTGFLVGLGLAASFEDQEERHTGRKATVAVASLAILTALLFIAPNRAVAEIDQDIRAFAKTEERVNGAFNQLLEGARKGEVSDAEAARQLREDIAPPWRAGIETLSAYTGLPATVQTRVDRILVYARKRQEAFDLFIEALETQDPGVSAKAQEAFKASNALAQNLSAAP